MTHPTLGTLTGYTFGPTDDDRRVQPFANGLYRRIPRTSDVYVGGLNVVWSQEVWTIEGDLGFAGQDTVRTLERLRTRLDTGYRSPGQDRLTTDAGGLTGTYDISSGYPIAIMYDADGNFHRSAGHHAPVRRGIAAYHDLGECRRCQFPARFHQGPGRRRCRCDHPLDEIMFGFAWNDMQFTRRQEQKSDSPRGAGYDVTTIGSVIADGILPDVNLPGFVHSFAVLDIDDPIFDPFYDNTEGYETLQNSEFDVTEENKGVYLQGNFSGGENGIPYRGNIGIRYTSTRQTNRGWVGEGEGDDFIPADPDNPKVKTGRNYDYWLPAFNLAYETSETTVLRFAANKALTRPDPIDLSSRIEINDLEDQEDLTANGGNPNLQPYTTNSFDAILEWYPDVGGSYAIGLFYKDLGSYIARGSEPGTD